MSQELITCAEAASVRVLESAAFLFTDVMAPESVPIPGTDWGQVGVRLEYEGPTRGELRMWISETLSKNIAANMLGLEEGEECSEEREMDAIKEILNMILGNFLTDAFGVEAVYHLGIPRIMATNLLEESLQCDQRVWLDAEGQPILITVHPES